MREATLGKARIFIFCVRPLFALPEMQIKRFLHKANAVRRKLSNFKLYNTRELHTIVEVQYLKKLIHEFKIDCVFDVGANHGQYALQLMHEIGYRGTIISFEPTPDLVKILSEKASCYENWHIEELALGASKGCIEFQCMNNSQFNSIHSPFKIGLKELKETDSNNTVNNTIQVKQDTLASSYQRLKALHGFKRPFLKMDTQGHDRVIFESGLEVIEEFVGLQSELSFIKLYDNTDDYRTLINLYERYGFFLSALIPNNGGHFPHLVEMDCAMINRNYIKQEGRKTNE